MSSQSLARLGYERLGSVFDQNAVALTAIENRLMGETCHTTGYGWEGN